MKKEIHIDIVGSQIVLNSSNIDARIIIRDYDYLLIEKDDDPRLETDENGDKYAEMILDFDGTTIVDFR